MIKFFFLFCVLALIGIAALEWEMLLPAINLFDFSESGWGIYSFI